jgi:hypothetical protein
MLTPNANRFEKISLSVSVDLGVSVVKVSDITINHRDTEIHRDTEQRKSRTLI